MDDDVPVGSGSEESEAIVLADVTPLVPGANKLSRV